MNLQHVQPSGSLLDYTKYLKELVLTSTSLEEATDKINKEIHSIDKALEKL